MAVDEFEIKQVHNEGNSSRSLVFKISKRIDKTSIQQGMAAGHKDTSNNSILRGELEVSAPLKSEPRLSSEPNLHDNIGIKHLIERGAAGDAASPVRRNVPKFAGQVAEKFGAVLRRSSKRIVLRVRDPNIEVKDKTPARQKIEDPSSESTKQGSSYGKMGRRRGGRKPPSEAVNPKSERRGRGRPRTVNRDQSAENVGKIVCVKRSKTPKKSVAVVSQADSSSVWTLVPKELVNSAYFKSHILKMQERPPRGRRPRKASHVPEIPQIPFSSRENIKVQFPKVTAKPAVEQHPLPAPPSRPTVIYFKAPKNGLGDTEANPPVSNQTSIPDQQQAEANSPEELQFSSYLRQSYGHGVNDAALGYVYGVSQRNGKRNEHLIRDVMSGRKQITAECSTRSNQQYFLQSHLSLRQENDVEPGNELALQADGYDTVSESPPVQSGCYISCRQVVVDAIRMLYDEESILGYA